MIKEIKWDKQAIPSVTKYLEPEKEIHYNRTVLPKVTEKKVEGLSVKASVDEAVKPYSNVRVVDKYKKVIGESQ